MCKSEIFNSIKNVKYSNDMNVMVQEIINSIKDTKSGKSPDHNRVSIEHLKQSSSHIYVLLGLLFTSIVVHGYLPKDIM